jgi:hypothetical protein
VEGAGDQSGLASGLFNTAQQVGNAVALALLATVAAARTGALAGGPPGPEALAAGFRAGFLAAAALCLLGLAAVLRLPADRGRRAQHPRPGQVLGGRRMPHRVGPPGPSGRSSCSTSNPSRP